MHTLLHKVGIGRCNIPLPHMYLGSGLEHFREGFVDRPLGVGGGRDGQSEHGEGQYSGDLHLEVWVVRNCV
jgi:hypothetical protein